MSIHGKGLLRYNAYVRRRHRQGRYGIDAPGAFLGLLFGAFILFFLAFLGFATGAATVGVAFLLGALYTAASAASHAYTAQRGKFHIWSEILRLRGDENVLDLGCGRGAVLTEAAAQLPRGRITGLDRWRVRDRSGDAARATLANAEREGVQVELVTGDLRALPFADGSFDVVLSSLAVHTLRDEAGRALAVREAYRVLRPGGRLLIADTQHTSAYEAVLRDLGATEVRRRDLGWRFWYGGPWFATWLVEADRPRG